MTKILCSRFVWLLLIPLPIFLFQLYTSWILLSIEAILYFILSCLGLGMITPQLIIKANRGYAVARPSVESFNEHASCFFLLFHNSTWTPLSTLGSLLREPVSHVPRSMQFNDSTTHQSCQHGNQKRVVMDIASTVCALQIATRISVSFIVNGWMVGIGVINIDIFT